MAEPQLAGPERLTLRGASRRGPCAGRHARLELHAIRFSVVNAGAMPCAINALALDPLRQSTTGTVVDASLRLCPQHEDMVIEAGQSITLELAGFVPARPSAYTTAARIFTGDGGSLEIPITIEVAASPLWGIAAMLLGLLCLGLIDGFAEEGAIKTQLRGVLSARQEIHTWLEANPAPQIRSGDIEAMDRDFDAAVTALSRRRRLSIVDHRATDAGEHLKSAEATANQLRRALAGRPRGAAEVEDLSHDVSELKGILQQIATMTVAPAATPSPDLAGKLDAFLLRYRARFLQQPVGWLEDEMASEFDHVRLAYAAGEGEATRDLALTARNWLRRSARRLNAALTGYRGALVMSGSMVATDQVLRARIARADFPEPARAAILAGLDAASATMDGDAWLPQWAAAYQQIETAKTAAVRAAADAVTANFAAAAAAVNHATDTTDVERLTDDLRAAPDHSLAAKQAGLTRLLDLWRAHIAGVDDAATREKLEASVDAIPSTSPQATLQRPGRSTRRSARTGRVGTITSSPRPGTGFFTKHVSISSPICRAMPLPSRLGCASGRRDRSSRTGTGSSISSVSICSARGRMPKPSRRTASARFWI